MARPPRIHFPGALYHVIVRGNHRQVVFPENSDYLKYQERLAHYQERYRFNLYAYVLLPNHVHLLVEVTSVTLSRIMQGIQFTYAQYFNKKYKKVGHLFQGRYTAILCEKETYLLELVRYIHLNPVRAQLVRNTERYRWSSYPVYLGDRQEPFLSTEFVLQQFGQRPSVARRSFRKFVNGAREEGRRNDLYQLRVQTCLGSDEFVEKIPLRPFVEEPLYEIPLKEITQVVCQHFRIKEPELMEKNRARRTAEVRYLIGHLAKELAGLSYGSVAQSFRREAISFGGGVRKIEMRLKKDHNFSQSILELVEKLKKGRRRKIH